MDEGSLVWRAFSGSGVLMICFGLLLLAVECYAELGTVDAGNGERQSGTGSRSDPNDTCQLQGKGVWEGQRLFRELSEAMPMYVGIVSAGFHVADTFDAHKNAESKCMNSTSDDSCWLALERSSDVPKWSLAFARNTSISFQGQSKCANGNLSGSGTTKWQWTTKSELRIVIGEGKWRNGKQLGRWKYQLLSVPCIGLTHKECRLSEQNSDVLNRFRSGSILPPKYVTTLEGRYKSGAKSGIWKAEFNKGDTTEIPYSNDLKHGAQKYTKITALTSQTESLTDSYEIPWVAGKKHGLQLKQNTFGEFEEIPWVRGVIHGESVFSWATGERETTSWVNGQQHETSIFSWPDGSRLTALYDEGMKIGYEVLSLLSQSGTDFISLESKYARDHHSMLQVERTITRKLNGHKHGVEVWIRPDYVWRLFRPYSEGKAHGTITLVLEGIADPYHFFFRERSRQRSLQFQGQDVGESVLIAADGFRQEEVFDGELKPYRYVTESSMDGNYRSRLRYEGGLQRGTSFRCWYDNIQWSDDDVKAVQVPRWTDGVLGLYTRKYVTWHGPLSDTHPNGLCLETPYVKGKKSGIEVQTQSNGYKAHIPMNGRHIAGPIVVFRPDGSRREIPYERGRKHGVVHDFSTSGDKTQVEEYYRGELVTP